MAQTPLTMAGINQNLLTSQHKERDEKKTGIRNLKILRTELLSVMCYSIQQFYRYLLFNVTKVNPQRVSIDYRPCNRAGCGLQRRDL